jgi:serine/threonine protein kinase
MDPQRWRNIAELYKSALPLTPAQRNEFLASNCASDTILHEELSSLLETEESSGEFLNQPIFEVGLKLLATSRSGSGNMGQDPDEFIGTVVDGRYEVVEKLGSGGIGDVYRAEDRKILHRAVVIKLLKDSSLNNPWVVSKFEQEIEALTKIADGGVVGVIDTGKLPNGKPYLVMEFVEGLNLREFMQRRKSVNAPLAFDEVAEIVRQTGRTLTSAHDAGIIHRDLKPANIMVRRSASGDLQVKVIDFGIAKITNSASTDTTTTGMVAGTIAYMSPEQLEGKRVTPASDVYALGVIAYEMVTGSRPFNPESSAMLPEFQRSGVKVLPRDLRPGLPQLAQAAILKALSYQKTTRYQRARDFGEALAEALTTDDDPLPLNGDESANSTTIATQHQSNPIPPVANTHRRRTAAVVFGFLLLPVIMGLVYAWPVWSTRSYVRTLTYSLTVQKQDQQRPVQSSGQEKFKTGDRFQLNLFSRESGYLYVLNEGSEDGGGTVFTLIFPTPKKNNGSARLDELITQTNSNRFMGPPDKEEFWIVWSASPVVQLEDAIQIAMNDEQGRLSNAAVVRRVREFLMKNADPDLETVVDPTKHHVDLRSKTDPLIKLVQLEHH